MAATGAVSMGMGSLNFGLFIKPMGDELGIGRAAFGWAQTARMGASSATSPLIGWLIDRYGSRVMLPVAALATGGALIGLAHVTTSWHLVVLFVVMGLVGMSGPGALVTTVPVLKWFVRNRGKAVAYVGLGIPIGALLFIPLTQVLINEIGWRNAWIVLATIGVVVIVPLGAIFIRRQPEDVGMLPDGGAPVGSGTGGVGGARLVAEEVSWTVREAVRDDDAVAFGDCVFDGAVGDGDGGVAPDSSIHGSGYGSDADFVRDRVRCGCRWRFDVHVWDVGTVGSFAISGCGGVFDACGGKCVDDLCDESADHV